MALELAGHYFVKLLFGPDELPLTPSVIDEFTIIQDMQSFLPSFRIKLRDTEGLLSHVIPFDRKMSKVTIQLSDSSSSSNYNDYNFMTYRTKPESFINVNQMMYDFQGLSDNEGFFSSSPSRSWSGSIKANIEKLAMSELGADMTEVSSSLDYPKTLLQPAISNCNFLAWCKANLIGSQGESAFQIFMKRVNGKSVLVCKSFKELIEDKVKFNFIINDSPYQDYNPVYMYSIFNNYKVLGLFGSKQQAYGYYDYNLSKWVEKSEVLGDVLSLSDYHLVDAEDSLDSNAITENGRSNDFTQDFKGVVRANYHGRIYAMAKFWITSWGLTNICPGDVVKVVFPQGFSSEKLFAYQYSGFWVVERVIHILGNKYMTKLLLTRNGMDTDQQTTLVKPGSVKTA